MARCEVERADLTASSSSMAMRLEEERAPSHTSKIAHSIELERVRKSNVSLTHRLEKKNRSPYGLNLGIRGQPASKPAGNDALELKSGTASDAAAGAGSAGVIEGELRHLVRVLIERGNEERILMRKVQKSTLYRSMQSFSDSEWKCFTRNLHSEVLQAVTRLHEAHEKMLWSMDARGVFDEKTNVHRAHTLFLARAHQRIDIGGIEERVAQDILKLKTAEGRGSALPTVCEVGQRESTAEIPPEMPMEVPRQGGALRVIFPKYASANIADNDISVKSGVPNPTNIATAAASNLGKRRSLIYNRIQKKYQQNLTARLELYSATNEAEQQKHSEAKRGSSQNFVGLAHNKRGFIMNPDTFKEAHGHLLSHFSLPPTSVSEMQAKDTVFKHFSSAEEWKKVDQPVKFQLSPLIVEDEIRNLENNVARPRKVGSDLSLRKARSRDSFAVPGFGNTFGSGISSVKEVGQVPLAVTDPLSFSPEENKECDEGTQTHFQIVTAQPECIQEGQTTAQESKGIPLMPFIGLHQTDKTELHRLLTEAWETLRVPYLAKINFLCKISSPDRVNDLPDTCRLLHQLSRAHALFSRVASALERCKLSEIVEPKDVLHQEHLEDIKMLGVRLEKYVTLAQDSDLATLSPEMRRHRRENDLNCLSVWFSSLRARLIERCRDLISQLSENGSCCLGDAAELMMCNPKC